MDDSNREKIFLLEIPGKPFGKQRPRHGKGVTYTPEETVNYENLVKLYFTQRYKDVKPIEGAVRLAVNAYFSIPKNTSKKKTEEMLGGFVRPTKKPDCDNILKIIADALNGIAWKDDAQIVVAIVKKFYDEKEGVIVKITKA